MRIRSPDRLLGFPSGFPLGMVPPKNLDERNSLFPHDFVLNSTSVAPLPIPTPPMTSSTIATTTTTSQAPILPTTVLSDIIQNLPSFGLLFYFDDRLRSLEENFSERMNKAVKVTVQIQSDRLSDEAQRENNEFLRTFDENIKKIIKEQVKEQVKVQVSKILPRIEQAVNKQLEAEVLTRSSHTSRTSYAVATDLSKMELKKILIEKMEGNKSIQRSDEQRNLYKALVEAYESDKIILDTYGETVTLKRRRDDDEDKDEEPFAGPDRGSKRRREGKEPESVSALSETATRSAGRSCKSLIELEYHLEEVYKTTTDQLDWVNPEGQQGASSRKYTTSVTKTKAADYGHIRWIEDLVPRTMWIQEPIDYDKHALWGKRLNLTKTDTYRSDLKRKEAYTAYSNPRGFVYQNKDKKNRLMRIDELHKFSDGTLTDVRTALDDRLKGIRIRYLPQTIWRKSDKDRATAMI
uniref:Uncharacterized protein n=1 Tax=Tanacetum cinerariifolium TaxID=118510 RepID=A0A699II56_TANCI|nr:hypothetical protein [Tanacetum cinerariifolium]